MYKNKGTWYSINSARHSGAKYGRAEVLAHCTEKEGALASVRRPYIGDIELGGCVCLKVEWVLYGKRK